MSLAMRVPKSFLFPGLVVLGLVVGFWAGASPSSPMNPNPQRPVLRALAGVVRLGARVGLWVALAGESPPPLPKDPPAEDRQQLVNAPAGDAAELPRVDHRAGW